MAVKSNDGPSAVSDRTLVPVGFEQLSVTTAVGGSPITAGIVDGASMALIQTTDQNIRWRDDGTDPTTTIGMQLADGSDFWYTADLSAIKFIAETGTAKVNISTYREK
jgi:hypothetical protein